MHINVPMGSVMGDKKLNVLLGRVGFFPVCSGTGLAKGLALKGLAKGHHLPVSVDNGVVNAGLF